MSDGGSATAVVRAQAAASQGDWAEAFDLLADADAAQVITPGDLPVPARWND